MAFRQRQYEVVRIKNLQSLIRFTAEARGGRREKKNRQDIKTFDGLLLATDGSRTLFSEHAYSFLCGSSAPLRLCGEGLTVTCRSGSESVASQKAVRDRSCVR